jgi:hypothetical protein
MASRAEVDFGGIRSTAIDWPIVLTEFPSSSVSDDALRSVLAHLEASLREALAHKERLFFITDITQMKQLTPARQRQIAGQWMKQTFDLSKAASVGHATVTPSAVLRGIMTAVFWITPSPKPTFPVATRHEAMLKGIEMLTAENLLLSPRLIAYRDKHRDGAVPPKVSHGR